MIEPLEDAVSWVRNKPRLFFRSGRPSPMELALHLAGDALVEESSETFVVRWGRWWIVGSSVDWLEKVPFHARELFFRIVPFVEAGPNSMRSEVIVNAFADQVVTVADERLIIRGDVPADSDLWEFVDSGRAFSRIIAFTTSPESLEGLAESKDVQKRASWLNGYRLQTRTTANERGAPMSSEEPVSTDEHRRSSNFVDVDQPPS